MAMIQSVSPIEVAARSERNWFIATVAWLIVGALVTGLLAVLLYRKTGKYQEALKADADARIEEAKRGAEEARRGAAEANERAARLEKEAADAKRALFELQQRVKSRHLSEQQRNHLFRLLSNGPKGLFSVVSVTSAEDAAGFATELAQVLIAAGWKFGIKLVAPMNVNDLLVQTGKTDAEVSRAEHLQNCLRAVGLPTELELVDETTNGETLLTVGNKPLTHKSLL